MRFVQCLACFVLVLPCLSAVRGDEPVAPAQLSVQLVGGRTVQGVVDARTNDQQLWLRATSGTAYVQRGIVWGRVEKADYQEKSLTREELQEMAATLATAPPQAVSGKRPKGERSQPLDGEGSQAESPLRAAKLVTISCSAWLANWDSDVEPDGIVLEVRGLDERGSLVEVQGAIEATLWSPVKRAFHERPATAGVILERVESWRSTSEQGARRDDALQVKLPFGSVHPDFQSAVGSYGALQVKVVSPGNGVFFATIDPLMIRTYSPIKDAYRNGNGGRHLPQEGTGRSVGTF